MSKMTKQGLVKAIRSKVQNIQTLVEVLDAVGEVKERLRAVEAALRSENSDGC